MSRFSKKVIAKPQTLCFTICAKFSWSLAFVLWTMRFTPKGASSLVRADLISVNQISKMASVRALRAGNVPMTPDMSTMDSDNLVRDPRKGHYRRTFLAGRDNKGCARDKEHWRSYERKLQIR